MVKPERTKVAVEASNKNKTQPPIEPLPYLIAKSGAVRNRIFYLESDRLLTIGRSEDSFINLDDDQTSRRHCILERKGSTVFLKDLNSTNGTQLNGKKILEEVLENGDEITIGNTTFVFQVPTTILSSKGVSLRSHSYFEQRLEEEIDRAARYRRSVSLLMIREEARESFYKDDGIMTGIIADNVRSMDIIGLYGSGQLEILFPETTKEEALKLAQNITDAALSRNKKNSIGIATYPEDAVCKEVLVEKSRRALMNAGSNNSIGIVDQTRGKTEHLILPKIDLIVRNEKMVQILDLIKRIAGSNITVLVQGETGSGKEVIAQAIHHYSPRSKKSLISVNCAALTETLLESELFGHEKGAFTGADRQKAGLFEEANKGTIFLDEIGEMSLKTQVKLLRVLQTRQVMRVGSTREFDVDVRVIAATNKNLEKAIEIGEFREDLFYRLNAITLNIPPLRDRKEEISLLVDSFLKEFSRENKKEIKGLASDVMELLLSYEWPGNIRELKNCIERAVVISEGHIILREHLPTKIFQQIGDPRTKISPKNMELLFYFNEENQSDPGNLKDSVDQFEAQLIRKALERCQGNQTKTADLLNIPRRTLVSKIRKYNL